MLIKLKKAQSSVEYITLFAVIVAAILIGQTFLKRKAQGYLRDYGNQLSSEGWSFSSSQEHYKEELTDEQTIVENVNTMPTKFSNINIEEIKNKVPDLRGNKIYSQVERTGGETKVIREATTDDLTKESYNDGDFPEKTFGNFSDIIKIN